MHSKHIVPKSRSKLTQTVKNKKPVIQKRSLHSKKKKTKRSTQLPFAQHSATAPLTRQQQHQLHHITRCNFTAAPTTTTAATTPTATDDVDDHPHHYNPLHVSSQIYQLYPHTFETELGFSPTDPKHANPPARLSTKPGLWGLRGIRNADDLDTLYIDKVHQIEARAAALLSTPTSPDSLQMIDDMSKLLCDIADLSEAVRNLHMVPQFQRKANSIHEQVQDLLGQWSSSPVTIMVLYNMIRTKDIWDNLSLEGRRIVLDLVGRMNVNTIVPAADYQILPQKVYQAEGAFVSIEGEETSWINIPSALAETLSQTDLQTITAHQSRFKFNSNTKGLVDKLTGTKNKSDIKQNQNFLNRLFGKGPTQFQSSLASTTTDPPPSTNDPSETSKNKRLPTSFRNSPHMIADLLTNIDNRQFRRLLHSTKHTPYRAQLDKLNDLIKFRHVHGLAHGHLSYAHSVNASLMSKAPIVPITAITHFLDSLAGQRLKEYHTMSQVLHKLEGLQSQHHSDTRGEFSAGEVSNFDKPNAKRPKVQSEIATPTTTTDTTITERNDELHFSDIAYVTNKIKTLTNKHQSELSNYLRLDSVLQGIGLVANVMDVSLEAHLIRPGEGWGGSKHQNSSPSHNNPLFSSQEIEKFYPSLLTSQSGSSSSSSHPPPTITNGSYHLAVHRVRQDGTWCRIEDIDDVSNHHLLLGNAFKLHLVDKSTDDLLGVLYIDPYSRIGKHGGGAQYAITLGRMAHEKTEHPATNPHINHLSLVEQDDGLGGKTTAANSIDGTGVVETPTGSTPTKPHQFDLPVSVLTTGIDVQPPTMMGFGKNKSIELPLLTNSHLSLLMHEVGHAFHAILNRTQYQHFSGPRCEMDFVETPSTLFEQLSEDPRFINMFARHHITGAKLPQRVLNSIALTEQLFPTHTITQTGIYGLIDLKLFGPESPIKTKHDVADPFKVAKQLADETNRATYISTDNISKLKKTPPTGLPLDKYRPSTVLQQLYRDVGRDIFNPPEDDNEGLVMGEILDNYEPTFATTAQSTLQTHSIYRRYGNIDLHEYGPGVAFDDISFTQSEGSNSSLKRSPTSISSIFGNKNDLSRFTTDPSRVNGVGLDLTALQIPTQITPQADHAHLAHYGGFYFSYLYCRAFANVIKKNVFDPLLVDSRNHKTIAEVKMEHKTRTDRDDDKNKSSSNATSGNKTTIFDQVLPTTIAGVNFRRKILQPGGSQVGLDILADFLSMDNHQNSTQTHDWPAHIFNTPYTNKDMTSSAARHKSLINSVGVLKDDYLDESQIEMRQQEVEEWVKNRQSAVPQNVHSIPQYPPHSQDLSIVYNTMTEFQHAVGWKVAADLPEDEEEETTAHDDKGNEDDQVEEEKEGQAEEQENPHLVALTPLQQRVLKLSFESLGDHIVAQSNRGLDHISKHLNV